MSGKPSESQPSSGRPHDGGDDGFLDALTNSPVIERWVDFRVHPETSHFEDAIPQWLHRTSEGHGYPGQKVRKLWCFQVEQHGEQFHPTAKVFEIPRIEKVESNGKLLKAIEVHPAMMDEPASLRFLLGRPTKRVTRFVELQREVETLLPDFLEALHIPDVGGLQVGYLNEFSPRRYPNFADGKRFHIGQILRFFQRDFGEEGSFVPPFQAQLNLQLERDSSVHLRYRIEDDKVKPPEIPGVLLTIEYDSFAKKSNRPVTDALTELSAAHDLILAQFFGMVPKEAYEAFQ